MTEPSLILSGQRLAYERARQVVSLSPLQRLSAEFIARGALPHFVDSSAAYDTWKKVPSAGQQKLVELDMLLFARMAGHKRLSGNPAIAHPRRVVSLMLHDDIWDPILLQAGLTHDAVEDKFVTFTELEKICGHEIRDLVEGETKLGEEVIGDKEERERANFIRWSEAAARDPRIVIIKAYDNLANWEDQSVFLSIPGKEHKPREHAEETLKIYVPILFAMGLWKITVRLADAALRYHDTTYEQDVIYYNEAVKRGADAVDVLARHIQIVLGAQGIRARVEHKIRHFSEIWQRAEDKKTTIFALLKDRPFFAHYISVLIEANNTVDCHAAKGWVNTCGFVVPQQRELNFLDSPRDRNGYRALHTVVHNDRLGGLLMIGYTTEQYNQMNELGILHSGFLFNFSPGWAVRRIDWIGRIATLAREQGISAKQMRDNVPFTAVPIVVYDTARGEACSVPANATALDFALSSNVLRIGKILVKGQEAPFDQVLRVGDRVTIIEDENCAPHPRWLSMVHVHESAQKIREYLQTLSLRELHWIGAAFLDEILREYFLTWGDIKHSTQISKIFKGDAAGVEMGVGLGQIVAADFVNSFIKQHAMDVESRAQQHKGQSFAIVCELEKDQPGIEGRLGTNFGKVGISFSKSAAEVRRDGKARLIFIFRLLSSVQRAQIFNIINAFLREVPGKMAYRVLPKEPTEYTLEEIIKMLAKQIK